MGNARKFIAAAIGIVLTVGNLLVNDMGGFLPENLSNIITAVLGVATAASVYFVQPAKGVDTPPAPPAVGRHSLG